MSDREISFEEALKKLEESSKKLKESETTLEEAMENYEKGLEAYRECKTILENASQKIETLSKQEA